MSEVSASGGLSRPRTIGRVILGLFLLFTGVVTSDLARAVRLVFQPLLVLWALWSTGAWVDRRTLLSVLRRR